MKALLAGLAAGLCSLVGATGALASGPTFKAVHWRVFVADSSVLGSPATASIQKVKPGGSLTLCNMDRMSELEIDYSYKNTAGDHFTLTISGPGGTSPKAPFGTKQSNGKAVSGYSFNALPGGSSPALAGKYSAQIRHGSKTLMRTTITLASSNTCT